MSLLPLTYKCCSLRLWMYLFLSSWCGPDSSVAIAADYGLDGSGPNPGGDEIFRPFRPALGHTQPPVKWVPCLSRRESAAGACCWPLYVYPPSTEPVTASLHLYLSSWLGRRVVWWIIQACWVYLLSSTLKMDVTRVFETLALVKHISWRGIPNGDRLLRIEI